MYWISYCDILLRYYLVAGKGHCTILDHLSQSIQAHADLWHEKSRVVDLEDARTMMRAFTERVTKPSALYPLLDLPAVG